MRVTHVSILASVAAALVIPRHEADGTSDLTKRHASYNIKALVDAVEISKVEQEKRDASYNIKALVDAVEVHKVEQEKRDASYNIKALVDAVEISKVEQE